MDKEIKCLPIQEKSFFRNIFSKLPGFCSYCGLKYIPCHSKEINIMIPLPKNGKFCPSGHEGYVDTFCGFGYVRQLFDNIKSIT